MSEVISVKVVADASSAQQQINNLKQSLQNITAKPIDINNESLLKASQAALELQKNLQAAVNVNTGKLDLSVFASQMQKSNQSIQSYAKHLNQFGEEGRNAFRQLTSSIAQADVPITQLNAKIQKFGQTIKNTITWQISSSMIHGVIGAYSQAVGYAKDLNESLNNIRIVTGQSVDQMARFAVEANKTAKQLSTTTTKYTDAALIYYQQGLSEADVKARTDVTVKLANAAGISAETASDQLTAIWNNFDNGTQSLEHYADVLVKLGAETASSSDEISQGMEKFASVADTVGLSYEYAAAALATVTAKTRQSADTVGTAFKTLFARLEGLKLGETLEDGTDLNKYSKALDIVGVKIKDTSGNIKDMDIILDDLGARWKTLGKDQQIALAQTVGGMRQYTQLIALMDNWDFFKENVSKAQNSDGALQKQQDIYAQSWEAASARLKASLEDIFDSLMNDEAIINFIDGLTKVADTIANVIDGLGGLKGILLTVATIIMSQYKQEIPTVISNLGQTFNTMFRPKYVAKQASGVQSAAITELEGMQKRATTNQEQAQVQTQLDDARLNAQYLAKARFMSSAEKESFRQKQNAIRFQNQMREQQGVRLDENQRHIDESRAVISASNTSPQNYSKDEIQDAKNKIPQPLSSSIITNSNQQSPSQEEIAQRNAEIARKQQEIKRMELSASQYKAQQDLLGNVAPVSDGPTVSQHKAWLQQQKQMSKPYEDAIRNSVKAIQRKDQADMAQQEIKGVDSHLPIKQQAEKLVEAVNGIANEKIQEATKELQQAMDSGEDIEQAVENFKNAITDEITEAEGQIRKTEEAEGKARKQYQAATGASEEQLDGFRAEVQEDQEYRSGIEGQNSTQGQGDQIEPQDINNKIGNVATALMSAATIYTATASAVQVLGDKSAGAADYIGSLVSAFGAVAMSAGQLGSSFESLGLSHSGVWGIAASVAISAISAIVGAYQNKKRKEEANFEKQYEESSQKAADSKAAREANQEVLNAYQAQQKAYNDLLTSDASNAEILQSQSELAKAALEVAEAYKIQGAAMLSLSGDSKAFNTQLEQAQTEQLKKDKEIAQNAQNAAEEKALRAAANTKAVNISAEQVQGSQIIGSSRLFKRGLNDKDEDQALSILSKYGSFSETGRGYKSDLIDETGNFTDINAVLDAYDDLIAAKSEMDAVMTNEERVGSEVYQSVVGEIESMQEAVEAYRQYGEDITAITAELNTLTGGGDGSLGKISEEVTDLKSFSEYRDKLIKSMASEQDLLDEGGKVIEGKTAEYDRLVEAVDKYLQQLPQIASAEQGNLSLANQALDEMVERREKVWKPTAPGEVFNTEGYKDAYSDLYDLFGNAAFDSSLGLENVNLDELQKAISQITKDSETGEVKIPVDLEDKGVSDRLLNIINLLQIQADQNEIQIKLSILENFDVGSDSYNTEALAELKKGLQEEWNQVLGKDFSISDFFLMSEDEQKQAIAQMQMIANEAKAVTDEAQLEKLQDKLILDDAALSEAAIAEENAYQGLDSSIDAVAISQNAFDIVEYQRLQKAQADAQDGARESLTAEEWKRKEELQESLGNEGFSFDEKTGAISGNGITDDNIDTVLRYAEAQNQLAEAETNRNNTAEAVSDLEAQIDAYKELGSTMEVLEYANKAYGVNKDELKEYAKGLLEAGKAADELQATQLALDGILRDQGVEELQKDYKDLSKTIDTNSKGTLKSIKANEKANKAFNQMKKSIEKMFRTKVSDGFAKWAKDSGKLEKALNGDVEALQELEKAAAMDSLGRDGIMSQLVPKGTPSGEIPGFETMVDNASNAIAQVKDLINNANLNPGDMINDADLLASLTNMVNMFATSATEAEAMLAALGVNATVVEDEEETRTIAQQPTYDIDPQPYGIDGAQTFYDVTPGAPTSDEATTTMEVPALKIETANMSSGGNIKNSGGGGGGGGGGKPKIKKKPSIDYRYHTNKQRKSNLESKIKTQEQKTEKAFGANKIESLKKQLELQEKLTTNTSDYIKEVSSYLRDDKNLLDYYKKLAGLDKAITFEFDKSGIIANGTEIRELLNNILANMEVTDQDTTHIENLIQAMDDYESTLEAWNDAMEQMIENLNKIVELGLEIATTKIELNIELDDLELEYLDYMLSKIEDDAWSTASAIGLMTQKLATYESKMATYANALDLIIGSRKNQVTGEQLNWDYLKTLNPEELKVYLDDFLANSVNFYDEEVQQLKDTLSEMLSVMEEYYSQYQEAMDKFTESIDFVNEKLDGQIEVFEHYSSILESTQEILKLNGLETTEIGTSVLKQIRNVGVDNAKNQIEALKIQLATQEKQLAETEGMREKALREARIQAVEDRWTDAQLQETLNKINSAYDESLTSQKESIRETNEEIFSSYEELFDRIKTNYEDLLEELVTKYQRAMSAGFGDYGVFEDAYERKKELDEEYLDDYEKLYELSKLTRNIQTSMDDTDNIKGKERLKTLQAEINALQADGVKLSQYDVDVLQRKYELELARQALEDAKTDGSLVRLSRDQEGNWGYVYTADEDAIAEKEQEYENKLYEYQKLNAEYMDTLEDKVLEVQGDYAEKLQEIMTLNLSDEEREKAVQELKADTEEKLRIIEESYEKVFGNQSGTLGLMEQLYKVTGPDLVDNWKETVLGMMSESNNLNDNFVQLTQSIKELTNEMIKAFGEYQESMKEAYATIDPNIKTPEDLAKFLSENTQVIKDLSTAAVGETTELADQMQKIFEDALKSMEEFQKEWLGGLKDVFDLEGDAEALQRFLNYLALNSAEDLVEKTEVRLEKLKEELLGPNLTEDRKKEINTEIDLLTMRLEQLHKEIADYYSKNTVPVIDGQAFDTGGYTGEWGPTGRLAWLHEKEIVLNPADTQNLLNAIDIARALDINTGVLMDQLTNMIPAVLTGEREAIQQEIYINAEFPDATDALEIQEAFNNLINDAMQYAHQR